MIDPVFAIGLFAAMLLSPALACLFEREPEPEPVVLRRKR